ncbi:hypothetical protein DPMN_145864 [Dreissena polymorpha]|uniref:Uncharacterized protein n=1 Tax=Dreissena polymorpha TaxID=45954 RepID=A0A9D4F4V3_DREPO|nr:hypothetical protein DPMN_145864 [Dreissena polymorpha]
MHTFVKSCPLILIEESVSEFEPAELVSNDAPIVGPRATPGTGFSLRDPGTGRCFL